MTMQSHVKFNSSRYKSCDWPGLLASCYEKNDINDSPLVIANHDRLLLPSIWMAKEKIHVVTPEQSFFVKVNKLAMIDHVFLQQFGVQVAVLSKSETTRWNIDGNYYYSKICHDVAYRALGVVRDMLHYSHDHLEKRESGGYALSKHESIKFSFATIICQLDSAEQLLLTANEIESIYFAFSYLLEALHLIAQLNGGRAMLKGNAVELMFHFTLFQSVFLSGKYAS